MKSLSRVAVVSLVVALIAASCGAAEPDAVETLGVDDVELASADGPLTISAEVDGSAGEATTARARTDNRARKWWSRRYRKGGRRGWNRRRVRPTTTTMVDSTTTTDPKGTTTVTGSSTTGASTSSSTASTTTNTTRPTSTQTTVKQTTTTRRTTTTEAQTTTTRRQTTTTGSSGNGRFETLAPGATLPSGSWCAGQVKSRPEIRSGNASPNSTRGTKANGRYPRVDGDFVGTTDEILQWAACKWGIDEDWARAQAAKESWWDNSVGGDETSDQSACHPSLRTNGATCPESIGLLQVRYLYHGEAFEDSNAIRSTAYNADYAFGVWRSCYNGEMGWLNDVDRGATYGAGDLEGCMGVWFTGRWYTADAYPYIAAVRDYKNGRIWETQNFINYG